jgi:hypothetical protein
MVVEEGAVEAVVGQLGYPGCGTPDVQAAAGAAVASLVASMQQVVGDDSSSPEVKQAAAHAIQLLLRHDAEE